MLRGTHRRTAGVGMVGLLVPPIMRLVCLTVHGAVQPGAGTLCDALLQQASVNSVSEPEVCHGTGAHAARVQIWGLGTLVPRRENNTVTSLAGMFRTARRATTSCS